jgi:hypothetical protein
MAKTKGEGVSKKQENKTENEVLIEKWVKRFRKSDFPHQAMTAEEKRSAYKKLLAVNFGALINKDKVIKQTKEGVKLAWSYFPHRWGIECSDKTSPMDAFNDDEHLRKVLKKVLRFAGAGISETSLRNIIGATSGVQTVSNFRPTAAGAIYRYFLPPSRFPQGGVVWDMSMGFGGRLFGAMACGVVKKYIGTDPSTPTFQGLQKIVEDFRYDPRKYKQPTFLAPPPVEPYNFGARTELHWTGSEKFKPDHESLDLCFTSPPYFDTERYTGEDTQSWIKFDTREKWLHGFMAETLRNCHHGLKPSAICAVNIAKVESYPTICEDMIAVAGKIGFKHAGTDDLQLALSRMMGSKERAKSIFKYEPVYVFQK